MITCFRSSVHWLRKCFIGDDGSIALVEEWFVNRGSDISNEDPAENVSFYSEGTAINTNAYPRMRPGFDRTTSV